MALIPCPECGREVSEKAPVCPKCGFEVNVFVERQRKIEQIYSEAAKEAYLNVKRKKIEEQKRIEEEKRAEEKRIEDAKKAETTRLNNLYIKAIDKFNSNLSKDVEEASKMFKSLSGWENSEEYYTKCENRIKDLQKKENIARENKKKKINIIKKCVILIIIVGFLVFGFFQWVYPHIIYKSAIDNKNKQNFDIAISKLIELDGYKDSEDIITECYYLKAVKLMNEKDYTEAIKLFEKVKKEYPESKNHIIECKYNKVKLYIEKKDYQSALAILTYQDDYKDSYELKSLCIDEVSKQYYDEKHYDKCIELCDNNEIYNENYYNSCYHQGKKMMSQKEYKTAIEYFKKANNANDAEAKIGECKKSIDYVEAIKYMENGELHKASLEFNTLGDFRDSKNYSLLCDKYKGYISNWECKTYVIYHNDGDISDLSYDAENNSVNIHVSITEDKQVRIKLNGSIAELDGNKLICYPYGEGNATEIFNLSTGVRTVQYYLWGEKSSLYHYTYTKLQ